MIWFWIPVLTFWQVFNLFWAPACLDQIPGGHAGVGVVSLNGAPLSASLLVTAELKEFKRLGRARRVTITNGTGCVVHVFVFEVCISSTGLGRATCGRQRR